MKHFVLTKSGTLYAYDLRSRYLSDGSMELHGVSRILGVNLELFDGTVPNNAAIVPLTKESVLLIPHTSIEWRLECA